MRWHMLSSLQTASVRENCIGWLTSATPSTGWHSFGWTRWVIVTWLSCTCTWNLHFLSFYVNSVSPSVLWHCCLSMRKSIQSVKNWVMKCWRGYLSKVTCKWFAYSLADATATSSSLASLKSRMVLPFWCQLMQIVLEKKPLNGCLCLSVCQYHHF